MEIRHILIAAPPGPFQEGLQVLLKTISGISITVTPDAISTRKALTKMTPSLLILDADLADIETVLPYTIQVDFRLIMHTNTINQPVANAIMVPKGSSPARLLHTIRSLLTEV